MVAYSLKCSRCNRKLKKEPVGTIAGMVFGAKCWRLIDNSQRERTAHTGVFRDSLTIDLWGDVSLEDCEAKINKRIDKLIAQKRYGAG